ncbi:unnamed protein product [Tenebrio molitor]|nr:unnamed protein product [Tenebrio molitor]
MLDSIRVIKLFNWGDCYKKKISKTRKEEVSLIYKVYLLLVAKFTLSDFILNAATYAFIIGLLWFGKQIKIETMFFLIHSLNIVSGSLKIGIPRGMHEVIKLFVVIRRIEQFLKTANVQLPSKRDCENETLVNITLSNLDVYVKKQKIFENVNLNICKGLNIVTGPIGSGKSVLMQILLQEYQINRRSMTITSRISYASEQPWLFQSTIKQNILFGANYNKERYLAVLQVCALLQDLQRLQGGDGLIIADRGTNLSKGQQCRINLARAVYRESEIYLLEGCLSNVDVLVADYIFEKCIKQFLNDKLVILVTQNPKHISQADSVIILSDQTAKLAPVSAVTFPPDLCNTMGNVKESENKITGEEEEEDELHETMNLLAETQLDKNIYQEIVEDGRIKFQKYVSYVQQGGGLISFIVVCIVFILAQFSKIAMHKLENNWYINLFSSRLKTEEQIVNYTTYNNSERENYEQAIQERSKMIYLLPVVLVIVAATTFLQGTIFFRLASINFHRLLATTVIDASMDFFYTHYVGNILNRFSEDLLFVDEIVPYSMYLFLNGFVQVVGIAVFLGTINRTFLVFALVLRVLPVLTVIFIIRTGRALKRVEISSRSSLIGRVSATPEGLPTIRSANMQNTIVKEFDRHLDLYTSASYLYWCWLRTVVFILQLYFVVYTMIIVIAVLSIDEGTHIYSATSGFDTGLVRGVKLEAEMIAVERILEYTRQKIEYKGGVAVEHWPQQHQIKFANVSLSYNREDFVLRDLNFTVEPQETVAIVGRTAAGKSSIISMILRLHKFEGKIFIDGVDITTLPLDTLRANISVISQDPVLFTGTVRENIDLNGKYTDHVIWNALRIVNLDELFPNLDHRISGADLNLSLGQKQLLCLARVIICNNKIVIMDEATTNVDRKTEILIHNIVQEEFASCTVILITHKLDYVLEYDKVMVLDGGSIIEFDRPSVLLKNQNGLFYKMYKKVT